mgnify:FL=1
MSKLYVNTLLPQSGNDVVLSGNLDVSGTLKAYQIETITYAATTYLGDTVFGNNSTDSHTFNGTVSGSGRGIFTGGVLTEGTVTATGSLLTSHNVSGSGKGIFVGGIETAGTLSATGSMFSSGSLSGSGKGIFVGGVETAGNLNTSGSLYALHNISGSGHGYFVAGVETQGTLGVTGSSTFRGNVLPAEDVETDLVSSSKRWANVHTADLHLKNERGDWTIVEEEDYLSVVNNKTGKIYKMVLEEIED